MSVGGEISARRTGRNPSRPGATRARQRQDASPMSEAYIPFLAQVQRGFLKTSVFWGPRFCLHFYFR